MQTSVQMTTVMKLTPNYLDGKYNTTGMSSSLNWCHSVSQLLPRKSQPTQISFILISEGSKLPNFWLNPNKVKTCFDNSPTVAFIDRTLVLGRARLWICDFSLCCVNPSSSICCYGSGPDVGSCTNAVNMCVCLFCYPVISMILTAQHGQYLCDSD